MRKSALKIACTCVAVCVFQVHLAFACSDNDVENLLAQCAANAQPDSDTQIIAGIWINSLVEALQSEADKNISSEDAEREVLKALKGCVRDDLWYDEVLQACGEKGTVSYIRNQLGTATN